MCPQSSARTAELPKVGSAAGVTDATRLRRVRDTGMLDDPAHPSLDRLARAAAHQLRAGRAQVALIGEHRRVVVGRAGPPLADSFCGLVVETDAPLLLGDARADERVAGHPAVAAGVIAYAGFPVRSLDGYPIGSFCVLDDQAREWQPRELLLIEDLAAAAETEIALRSALRALGGTARRLAGVLDGANDAYVSIDLHGAVTAWNRAAERLFGYPGTEARGRPIHDLIIPERYRGEHLAGLQRLLDGGRSALAGRRMQLTAHDRTGAEFPVEMTLHVVAADGEPEFHAFLHDTTERHRGETLRGLQLEVARVLAEADTAEQAVDGVVETVARRLGWAFGEFWQADDATGTIARAGSWASPTHDLALVTGNMPFVLARGEGLAGHIWADGAELWVTEVADDPRTVGRRDEARRAGLHTAIGLPVRSDDRILGVLLFFSTTADDPDEELIGLLDGVCAHLGRHIERRRAEDLSLELTAARRDFARVTEQVNDHVWTVEVLAKGMASLYASPDASKIFGEPLPAGANIAATMAERVHPDDRPIFARFIAELRAGEPADAEMRLIGADAVTRWVWIRAVPRFEQGRFFVDGISTNITDRRHLSEQREQLLADQQEQNNQLRHLDQVKDELVALVSHELRNPLSAIRSYSESLLDDADLTPDQRHLAEVIDRRSGHMQHLVDDLLDVARLEAGQLHIDPKPLSATRLIRDVVQAQRPAAEAKSLTVTVETSRHVMVQADPVRIRQVLDNLVANAVKYTPAGGKVTITARPDAEPGDDASGAVITVADTGIGIPADELPHLFDRFFRASNAVQQGIKGTGLGLAITKAIVDAHGGTLTATAGPVAGTAFTLTLPPA
jgi:PAS domain S-box-containing protein